MKYIIFSFILLFSSNSYAESTCIAKRMHYLQLYKGMTYGDVVGKIGCLGEETFGWDSSVMVVKNYTWRGDDYGMLTVTFINGRLDSTMQMGLK